MKFCIYGFLSLLSHEDGNNSSNNLKKSHSVLQVFLFL